MNLIHGQILAQIQRVAKENPTQSKHSESYDGNSHVRYHINAAQRKEIVKSVLASNKDVTDEELLITLHSLYKGKSSDEKYCGGIILQKRKGLRELVEPEDIDEWLKHVEGWAEIDTLCQSTFGPDKYLNEWRKWSSFLVKLSKDRNISKRRASLVLLVKPVRNSNEEELADLSLEIIDKLKYERDILITKAISWLLRSMIKNYRNSVESYLVRNLKVLPAIAIRETRSKLLTGRK